MRAKKIDDLAKLGMLVEDAGFRLPELQKTVVMAFVAYSGAEGGTGVNKKLFTIKPGSRCIIKAYAAGSPNSPAWRDWAVLKPDGMARTKCYTFTCGRCGGQFNIFGIDLFRGKQAIATPKCPSGCGADVNLNPAVKAEHDGTVSVSDGVIHLTRKNGAQYSIVLADGIQPLHGLYSVQAGMAMTTGRLAVKPKGGAPGLSEAAAEAWAAPMPADWKDNTPRLFGVFFKGKAPGVWNPETELDRLIAGAWAKQSLEGRPFEMLRGLKSLHCTAQWAMNTRQVSDGVFAAIGQVPAAETTRWTFAHKDKELAPAPEEL